MKVVIHNDGQRLQGSERQLAILAEGLTERGHEVIGSVLAGGGLERELRRLGIRTTRVRPKGDAHLLAAFRFYRFLRREAPDAVLCTSWPRLFWATLAARRAGVSRLVGRLGIVRPAERRWKYRSAFNRLDALIANSREVKETFVATAPELPPHAVHVVHNATLPGPAPGPGSLREDLGLDAGTRLTMSVGALVRRKGYDLLLKALAEVPGPHLAIAGQGPWEEHLRTGARELGIDGRVHFLGRRDDVPALLAGADLFVLASRNDSLPNAMLEAMAAGVPVLVTTVAGVRTALAARGTGPAAGWMVAPDDVDALRRALEVAVAKCRTEEGRAMAAEGARRAREWFSPERMVAEVEAVLAGGVADGPGPPPGAGWPSGAGSTGEGGRAP
ncbi:MAG: glycosyltransferase [Longimicrobiales bacterium]